MSNRWLCLSGCKDIASILPSAGPQPVFTTTVEAAISGDGARAKLETP